MTLTVTHSEVTGAAADPTALVDGPAWDANHTLTGSVGPEQGGTGVANNSSSTITISGNFGTTFTISATTTLTLPTSGTLAILGANTFTDSQTITKTATGADVSLTVNNAGTVSNSATGATLYANLSAGTNTDVVVQAVGGSSPSGTVAAASGLTGGLNVAALGGPLALSASGSAAITNSADNFSWTTNSASNSKFRFYNTFDGGSMNLEFYGELSTGVMSAAPAALINPGWSDNTAGQQVGDIDFIIYGSGGLTDQRACMAMTVINAVGGVGGYGSFVPCNDAGTLNVTNSFTGSISGTTLTVSGFSGDAILVGHALLGTGVTEGTNITAFGSGSGGNGTYTVSASQTVGSTTMQSGTAAFNNLGAAANRWNTGYIANVLSTNVTATTGSFTDISIAGTASGAGVATANTASTLVKRDASGNFSAGTITATLSGTATNATNSAITNDITTNATVGLVWVTSNTGNLPLYVSGTKLLFNPSTGVLSSTSFTGAGTGLTGTGASFTAGNVTTNANLTGPITSSGNATAVASQTGTGSTFVMNTSPTLVTPLLGTPTSGVLTNCTGTASGLTAGYVSTTAAFLVTKSTDQTGITDATATTITWDTEAYDIGSYFASDTWTPPAGYVHISVGAIYGGTIAAGTLCLLDIYKNGAAYKRGYIYAAANSASGSLSFDDHANGSDAYTAVCYIDVSSGTGTVSSATVGTYFSGHRFGV